MPFIGNQPALSYTSFAKQDFTTSATTSYTLDHPVANANEIALFINFVRQEPTTAYTASGTSLTLTSATSASDDMYCVFLGKAVQTVNPPNSSVGSSQVSADLITGQTALGATPADTDELLISDAGTLKRVDYSYLKSSNTPAFMATMSASQVISTSTFTKVEFDTETFDTNSNYDTSNYRFTPTTAGKYQVGMQVRFGGSGLQAGRLAFYKNGSEHKRLEFSQANTSQNQSFTIFTTIIELNGSSDYIEAFVYLTGTTSIYGNNNDNYFLGYKLIG